MPGQLAINRWMELPRRWGAGAITPSCGVVVCSQTKSPCSHTERQDYAHFRTCQQCSPLVSNLPSDRQLELTCSRLIQMKRGTLLSNRPAARHPRYRSGVRSISRGLAQKLWWAHGYRQEFVGLAS